jgi:hypothetical protein
LIFVFNSLISRLSAAVSSEDAPPFPAAAAPRVPADLPAGVADAAAAAPPAEACSSFSCKQKQKLKDIWIKNGSMLFSKCNQHCLLGHNTVF